MAKVSISSSPSLPISMEKCSFQIFHQSVLDKQKRLVSSIFITTRLLDNADPMEMVEMPNQQ